MPWPAAQEDHATHKLCALPIVDLNLPAMHVVQVRSLDIVAGLSMNNPWPHGPLMCWHEVLLSTME
jgi:hypothetical protein